jgi:LPS-assembly protein
MRNKFNFLKILVYFFSIFFSNLVLSDELKFSASKIEFFNEGNLIKGSGGVQINDSLNFIITGDILEYDKPKSLLKVLQNVLVKDKLNENILKSNQVIFNKKSNIITTRNNTFIELGKTHVIESSDVTFDRNLNTIFSNNPTLITDLTFSNNKVSMSDFVFSISEKILSANNVKIEDGKGNTYSVENIKYNTSTNEILGKDLNLSFNNNSNGNENQPRLKGNSIIYNNDKTRVHKGVFTTCKKDDKCPPWTLNSEQIEHDKLKKTINYKNAWLKVYDVPVIYFPKFFHPDPTVKRQSGFLVPKFSQSNNLGNYLLTPYFKVLSESSDLTFSPRFYDNGNILYQTEYRKNKKNSEHIVDFSILNKGPLEENSSSSTHFFFNSKYNLDLNSFDQSKLTLNFQQTSADDYLKANKLKSQLIQSENLMYSYLDFEASREDLEVEITSKVYENLSLPNNDRYEFVLPSFNILKNINKFDNGNLTLNLSGNNKYYNTNINEKTFINDLKYQSYNKISALGLVSNYEVLLKNFNVQSKNSTKYKGNSESTLQSIINYEVKYPLQKIGKNYLSILTPKFSARYSPNKSKNKSQEDRTVDLNNIFSINRIGFSDTVEGGQSITLGSEYALNRNTDNNEKILSVSLASVLRDEENGKLPINTTIGKKNSDIFGNIYYDANKFINFDYNFALDNNLETFNFNQFKSTLTFYNFVSSFDFLERNNLLNSESFISNETRLQINDSSYLGFRTRRNKEKNLTEYYNLIYEYKNDCLAAGIEYKKDFYSDGSLKPDEQLFFSITIMPFGKANTPNLNQ